MKAVVKTLLASSAVAAATGAVIFANKPLKERNAVLEKGFKGALSLLSKGLPPPAEGETQPVSDGMAVLSRGSDKGTWSLGYASKSIMPEDIDKKQYCIGGVTKLPANYAKGVLNDIRVRAVSISDGTGIHAFAVADCIGVPNYYVAEIRKRLKGVPGLSSVNVAATHCHSSVDTQGIWGPIVSVIKNNRRVIKKGRGEMQQTLDLAYMEFFTDRVCECIREAVSSTEQGKLYCARMGHTSKVENAGKTDIADIGIADFVRDRREPFDCSSQLLRLRFVPDDKSHRETVIINMAAHPYFNCLPVAGQGNGDMISGDYVYHMGEFFENEGYNFLFFNGSVAAVYPLRPYADTLPLDGQARAYANEVGRIALAMTECRDSVSASALLSPDSYESASGLFPRADGELSFYRGWLEKKGDSVIPETEVEPVLTLLRGELGLAVDNPIYTAVGSLGLGKFGFRKGSDGNLVYPTEVGFMRLGASLNIALIPGELEPSLVSGSLVMKGEYSFSGEDFSGTPLAAAAGDGDLHVFGLMNDAVGYIIPDNDFSMVFLGTGAAYKLFGNHYLEIFSFGKKTASAITERFKKLVSELNT